MSWIPNRDRYNGMKYNRCGKSGLKLPAISLGLWHNFGDKTPHENKVRMCRTAFDLGITHFDLANNYGPLPGSAESFFGDYLKADFAGYRDELIVTTKAGYLMWPGPYGEWGSRKYLLASLDQSLKRLKLDYVDIFYSHRYDPDTPLEETMGALDQAVRSGKAIYAGVSSYGSKRTVEAHAILKELGTPCIISQPSYSLVNRWVEKDGLLDTLETLGMGMIAFSPLAQGLLTSKYLEGIPEGSRATKGASLSQKKITPEVIENIKALNKIAGDRGQNLAQMALSWVLRDSRVTSALIGASSPKQITECAAAADKTDFAADELKEIDKYAKEANINLWKRSSDA